MIMAKIKYIVIFILALIIIIYMNGMHFVRFMHLDNHIKSGNFTNNTFHNRIYRVLMWTKYFNSDDWLKFNLTDLKCEYSNCILTADRKDLRENDAIVFHWRDIDIRDMPRAKLPNQKWILYNMESPNYTPIEAIYPLAKHLDWIMSYRLDSDIYTPYGRIEKCMNNNWQPNFEFTNKKRSIAWIVSHCGTHSNRENYVKKLQQYIDVDIYGSCGNLSCSRDPSCYLMIERNYKYYLSFENSMCKDYVTEKLFKYIRYDIIPIVMGAADYASFMPDNSYIDTFNFSSPKHLASYLKQVASDQNMYNSYFNWKKNYCVEETHWTYLCDLCKKLNFQSVHQSDSRRNIIDWWFQKAKCNNSLIQSIS